MMALIVIKSFVGIRGSDAVAGRALGFIQLRLGRPADTDYTRGLPGKRLREPAVFDSFRSAGPHRPAVGMMVPLNGDDDSLDAYFTRSFTRVVSILIPGPIVVDTAIPFR